MAITKLSQQYKLTQFLKNDEFTTVKFFELFSQDKFKGSLVRYKIIFLKN